MSEAPTILIVDDEMPARFGMRRALSREGWRLLEAETGEQALTQIEAESPDLVLLDINMPGLDGMRALELIRQRADGPEVVMVTAHGSEKLAVEAMKNGAYHYIPKPYDVDELRQIVHRALEHIRLTQENARLRAELETLQGLGDLIGASRQMQHVFSMIKKVKDADVTVLVTGESGTGKELVAREIHRLGSRQKGPFVTMNCAALPENLIESELFGHERGAFTGATDSRSGKFELADGGILFLDEIGDMSLNTQAKVLRALQEREFQRLGGTHTRKVDVRLISATNLDLERAIALGRFREDLYYRIKVVEIQLPALRDRPTDIPTLVHHFTQVFARQHNRPVRAVAPEALKLLVGYAFKGNVRELKNLLEQAVVLTDGQVLGPDDLPAALRLGSDLAPAGFDIEIDPELSFKEAKKHYVQAFEKAFIEARLREFGGNITKTAEALGMHRQSLQHKLRELGINASEFSD